MDWTLELTIVGRTLFAALLGAVVGLERETKNKPAGLRTHLLVAAAAALLVQLGEVAVLHFQSVEQDELLQTDPIRIIEAIATGISFIGAGTILFDESRGKLEGITIAASILVTAALGIAVGLRAYIVALALTVFVAIILRGIGAFERRMGWEQDEGGSDLGS